MNRTVRRQRIHESDYYRAMLRKPPRPQAAAYLVWVRMMARVLVDVQAWTPCFATAFSSTTRSLDVMRPYCQSGAYEDAFARGLPHPIAFLEYFFNSDHPVWLKDIARCEAWASARAGKVPAEWQIKLRRILGIRRRRKLDFLIVSHDALETLQQLVGYADFGMIRGGGLLWLLRVSPIYPVVQPSPRPGIVVFSGCNDSTEMRFMPAEVKG